MKGVDHVSNKDDWASCKVIISVGESEILRIDAAIQISIVHEMMSKLSNIARGTTDPGYWVYNLNDLFNWIEFAFNLAAYSTQVSDSIPWVRCACGSFLIFNISLNQICILFQCTTTRFVSKVLSGGSICISSSFGHQVALLELVTDVATRWHNLH